MVQTTAKFSFQEFLEEFFLEKIDPQCDKDHFEDRFSNWVSDMQFDDWVGLGNAYGLELQERIQNYYSDMAEDQYFGN